MTQFTEYGPAEGGRWFAEIQGCPRDLLVNADHVSRAVRAALEALGQPSGVVDAHVRESQPDGVVGTITSPLMMVTVHTWPDESSATFDLYLYRTDISPEETVRRIAESLEVGPDAQYELWRGARPERHVSGTLARS